MINQTGGDGGFSLIQSASRHHDMTPSLRKCSNEAAKLLLKVKDLAHREVNPYLPRTQKLSIIPVDRTFQQDRLSQTILLSSDSKSFSDKGPLPSELYVTPSIVTPPQGPVEHKHFPEPLGYDLTALSPTSLFPTTGSAALSGIVSSRSSTCEPPPAVTVVRPKFSWKSYPELERYLIKHRAKYLQLSTTCNYTKEQRRYNNRLTHDLLEIAGENGYVFEGFSFAAVRDRIRCYYKGYVQSCKKRNHRRR